MTIPDELSGAVLVQAGSPPDVVVDRLLDVRPGPGTTHDGDCRRIGLAFVHDGRYGRSYGRDEFAAAVGTAAAHVEDGGTVRLGNRARLGFDWSKTAIWRLERRLATAAGESVGAVLTWTDDAPGRGDERLYDLVVRR